MKHLKWFIRGVANLIIVSPMSYISTGVIIPRFSEDVSSLKYFIPRFAKIQRGETVQWTNLDVITHSLSFYQVRDGEGHFIMNLGPISPGSTESAAFQYDIVDRVDYYCNIHTNERGTVIIFSQSEESMTNTQRLRFLSRVFNITLPDTLAHLRG